MLLRRAAIVSLAVLALHFGGGAMGAQATPEPACATIHVIDHGWHAGIVVPVRDFGPGEFFPGKQFSDWRWLEFGWGDAAFYQTPDAGLALAFRALLTPTETVMHVVGFNNPPAKAFPTRETLALRLSASGYRKVLGYIKASFARDAKGRVVLSKDGGDDRSGYFKALGSYSILRTCNTWLAESLVKGGLPVDPDDAARAGDLMAQLRVLRWNGCQAARDAPEPEKE